MTEVPEKDGYTVARERVDTAAEDVTVKTAYTEILSSGKPESPQMDDRSGFFA